MKDLTYRTGIALVVMLFLALAIVAVSLAQQSNPKIEVDSTTITPGARILVNVSGFRAGERVNLFLSTAAARTPEVLLGDFVVETDGTFEASVVLPDDWPQDAARTADLVLNAVSADGTTMTTLPLAGADTLLN